GRLADLEAHAANAALRKAGGGHDDVDLTWRNGGERKMAVRVGLGVALEAGADLNDPDPGGDAARLRIDDAAAQGRDCTHLSGGRRRRQRQHEHSNHTETKCDAHTTLHASAPARPAAAALYEGSTRAAIIGRNYERRVIEAMRWPGQK